MVPDTEQLLCLHLLGVFLVLEQFTCDIAGNNIIFSRSKNNLLNFNGNLFLSRSKTTKEIIYSDYLR